MGLSLKMGLGMDAALGGASAVTPVNPGANSTRFWVGGTGNWDFTSTTNWSATTGGTAGASAPGQTDNVVFDASSGGGTVTLTSFQNVKSITMGAFTGSIITSGKTITAQTFSGTGTGTRTLNISNSTINLSGAAAAATVWNFTTTTNLTLTATGSRINVQSASAHFVGGSLSYGTVAFTSGGNALNGSTLLQGSNTFVNLSFVGTSSFGNNIFALGSTTQTVTGTFTATGDTAARLWLQSNAIGTNRTVNAAAVSLANVDFSNITAAGAASPFTGTLLGDFKSNTNITTSTPKTVFWVGNTGSWSDAANHWAASSGGTPGVANTPLPQDTITFDANSFTLANQTITQDTQLFGTVDFTGVTNPPTLLTTIFFSYFVGNLTFATGMTSSGSVHHVWYLQAGQTATYTSNGVQIFGDVHIQSAPTGVLQFGDNINIFENLIVDQGTVTTNNHNVMIGTGLVVSNPQSRTLNFGTSTITFATNQTSGTIANLSGAGLTANISSASFVVAALISYSFGDRIFNGAGLTFGNFTWADTLGGTGGLVLQGANTFASFTVNALPAAKTLTFPASTTTTATAFSLTGSSGKLLSIASSTSGTAATVSQASGTVAGDFLSLKDSTATGGATFNATHSTNVSGNTGWTITA